MHTPPLEVHAAVCEPLDDERMAVRLSGTWTSGVPAVAPRLTLVIDTAGERHRYPAVPWPRQAVGAEVEHFEARFIVLARVITAASAPMTLLLGETAIEVPSPAMEPPAPAAPVPVVDSDDAPAVAEPAGDDPLGPLRQELIERARADAQLRGELAKLRAQLAGRDASSERLEAVREELAAELVRFREVVSAQQERRSEVESRAMVLAAELAEAEQQREESAAALEALREEGRSLRERVDRAEGELSAAHRDVAALRNSELGARAEREAALAEITALGEEVERLGAELASIPAGAVAPAQSELQRAESLLAEARALTESLE